MYIIQVVRIDTPHGDSPPAIPTEDVNYHRDLNTRGWRQGLKPLTVVQPEGASFSVRLPSKIYIYQLKIEKMRFMCLYSLMWAGLRCRV